MPITMQLRENGHVAHYVLTDPWETADLVRLYPQGLAYRKSVPYPVHTLMDISAVQRVPSNILAARRGAPAFVYPNSGEVVMVGAHGFPQKIAEMIFKLAHYERVRFFDTEIEGWNYLRQVLDQEQSIRNAAVG